MADEKKPAAAPRKTVEVWAAEKKTPAWLFAGAKAGNRWPIGRELEEAEYDQAVHAAANVKIGG
jgi:hypothetical protein